MVRNMQIKICGLKTLYDIESVNMYKPDYIGFVFANTRRFVSDDEAVAMKRALDTDIKAVGVFVDEPMEHILRLCDENIIDVIQLHGSETDEYIRQLKDKSDKSVIKALRVQSASQLLSQMPYEADFILFDTYKKGEPGGTGERFCTDILHQALAECRERKIPVKPYFIAGGINEENLCDAVKDTDCICVDVSSGVETGGKKDREKIARFIKKARKL